MELTQQERETLIRKALARVAKALVCSKRGVLTPAKWSTPRITGKKRHPVVNLRPTNGILDRSQARKYWKTKVKFSPRMIEIKGESFTVHIRTP
jgi:hypothetical protein